MLMDGQIINNSGTVSKSIQKGETIQMQVVEL